MEAHGEGVQGPLGVMVEKGIQQPAAGITGQGELVKEFLQSRFIEVFRIPQDGPQ